MNQKKHGVSFEEAKTVFYDDNAIQFWDDYYFNGEERFLLLEGHCYIIMDKSKFTAFLNPLLLQIL
ncbi:MAG: BrnT family toxin [Crocosphaera sp.]